MMEIRKLFVWGLEVVIGIYIVRKQGSDEGCIDKA
jgi:hypothetical protein